MKRKIPVLVALSLMILAVALTVCITMLFSMNYFSNLVNEVNERRAMYEYISEIDTLIRKNYDGVIDEQVLQSSLAKGYIDGVGDKYAAYYTSEEYAAIRQQLSGKYTGFGLEISIDAENRLVVTGVYKDSAADKAGIQKQDVLVAVDGSDVSAKDFESVQSRLENSSKMMLSASRGGTTTAYNLTSGAISLTSVEEKIINETTGYIRIYRFSENTPDQFRSAYAALLDANVENVIFDLRDNAGGSLTAASEVVAYLMPRGVFANKVVASTGETESLSANDTHQIEIPSVTLVNNNTAGEAELFAGVLQEFGKTMVVGTQTAGRAMTQEYFTLSSDSAGVRLSVATLERVSGGSWEESGITPGQTVEMVGGQSFELLTEQEDTQLQEALRQLAVMQGNLVE